jgi:hypothetical protein
MIRVETEEAMKRRANQWMTSEVTRGAEELRREVAKMRVSLDEFLVVLRDAKAKEER